MSGPRPGTRGAASQGHPSPEAIAALAEAAAGPEAESIREHLADCAACRAHFDEAVRRRARALAGAAPEAVDAALLDAARAVPERVAMEAGRAPRPAARRPAWRRPLPAVAGAALILALALTLARVGLGPRDPLSEGERTALIAALAEGSARGMILPGAEGAPPVDVVATRSGAAVHETTLEPLLARLAHLAEDDRAPASVYADLAAGYLALDRVADAQGALGAAVRRFPSDPRLITLGAVAAYRVNQVESAERLLREALEADPRYAPARFNLALLLHESGRPEQARAAVARLAAPRAETLLRSRLVEIGAAR